MNIEWNRHNGRPTDKKLEKFYTVWGNMEARCYNKKNASYKNYGAKGITVCDEWFEFKNFYRDMFSKFALGLVLDRIDGTKGYSKKNCRWVTRLIQNNNTSRVKRFSFNGKNLTFVEWGKLFGIHSDTLRRRYYLLGWEIEKCLTKPSQRKHPRSVNGRQTTRAFD